MFARRNATAIVLLITIVVICGCSFFCLEAQQQGVGFLSWASPAVTWWVRSFGERWAHPTWLYAPIGYSLLAVTGVLVMAMAAMRKHRLAGLLLLCLLPCAGEFLHLYRQTSWGLGVCGVALLSLGVFFRFSPVQSSLRSQHLSSMARTELVCFCLVLLLTAGYRYYLLNLIPSSWDTELCDYRYTALVKFSNLLAVEAAQPRPTSNGFSWTLLFWLIGNTDEPDSYYLYIRLVGTALSMCKFALLYVAIRYISGPIPAFFGVLTLAFAPPENWWAREPSGHQIPGLMAVLIIFATARAYATRSWFDFAATAFLSALSRAMYASGLFLVFIPLSFFLLVGAFRWREWKREWLKICLLCLGPTIWLLWTTCAASLLQGKVTFLPPLSVPSVESTSGGLVGLIGKIFTTTLPDLLTAIFAHQVNSTHWTVAMTIAPSRSTSSLTVILGLVGLARLISGRAGPMSLLLLTAIFWAAVPGLVTSVADRRVGALFVVLIMFAAQELSILLATFGHYGCKRLGQIIVAMLLVVTSIYQAWIAMGMHFRDKPGLPIQVVQGRLIRPLLEPGTLVVYLSGGLYCDSFMSVLRPLREANCSVGWSQPMEEPGAIDRMIEHPQVDLRWMKERAPDLARCYEESQRPWSKVRFIFTSRGNWSYVKTKLEHLYPEGTLEVFTPPEGSYSEFTLYSYTSAIPQA